MAWHTTGKIQLFSKYFKKVNKHVYTSGMTGSLAALVFSSSGWIYGTTEPGTSSAKSSFVSSDRSR